MNRATSPTLKTSSVSLTDDELALLNGHVRHAATDQVALAGEG